MCTNFVPTTQDAWVNTHFGVSLPTGYPPEAYPGYAAPVVVKSHQTGRLACSLAQFGLIPAWAQDAKIARHTYNARSETAHQKPSFRTAWRNRQWGLVLADQFFEPSYATGKAQRWSIAQTNGEPMAIACLWDRWINPSSGERVVSFSMLTVNAGEHPVMQQFHKPEDEKRTPVVLPPSQFQAWLDADLTTAIDYLGWADMPTLTAKAAPR